MRNIKSKLSVLVVIAMPVSFIAMFIVDGILPKAIFVMVAAALGIVSAVPGGQRRSPADDVSQINNHLSQIKQIEQNRYQSEVYNQFRPK